MGRPAKPVVYDGKKLLGSKYGQQVWVAWDKALKTYYFTPISKDGTKGKKVTNRDLKQIAAAYYLHLEETAYQAIPADGTLKQHTIVIDGSDEQLAAIDNDAIAYVTSAPADLLIPEEALFAKLRDLFNTTPVDKLAKILGRPELVNLPKTVIKSVPLQEIIDFYANRQIKPLSKDVKRSAVLYWKEFTKIIGKQYINEIADSDITKYEQQLYAIKKEHNYGDTWLKHRLEYIKIILRYALRKRLEVKFTAEVLAYCASFDKVPKAKEKPNPITKEQYQKCLAACGELPTVATKATWRAIFLFAMNTASYFVDCRYILKENLLEGMTYLCMDRKKTGKDKVASLWPETTAAIEEMWRVTRNDTNYVFISNQRKIYSESGMNKYILKSINPLIGFNLKFGMIRDGAKSAMAEGKIPQDIRRIVMGHSNGIDDAYLKRVPVLTVDAVAAIHKYYME